MLPEELLANSWDWLFSHWEKDSQIKTFSEDRILCEARKAWYKETMPLLKNIEKEKRVNISKELNLIYELSDCSMYPPEDWEPIELEKWKQKYN